MMLSTLLLVVVLAMTSRSVTCNKLNMLQFLTDKAKGPMTNSISPLEHGPTSGHADDVLTSLGRKARPCDVRNCKLPFCKCSSTEPPNNMTLEDIPQMVVFSFQNAINEPFYQHYVDLFANRWNPNNCPAVGTFFVQHNYTDYFLVQSLWSQGHQIGDNTVTFQTPTTYWDKATYEIWRNEIESQAQILTKWANMPRGPVGFRAPYLQLGGDEQFAALMDTRLGYDASRPSVRFSNKANGYLWPYTYDYLSTQDCVIGRCPVNSYPGLWQMPLAALWDKRKTPCTVLGACFVENEDDVYKLLMDGFWQHYVSNRAPYVLDVDAAWMMTPFKKAGTLRFLDQIQKLKDVYMVSDVHAILWSMFPTKVADLKDFWLWQCDELPRPICSSSQVNECHYNADRRQTQQGGAFKLRTCVKTCPPCYPGLGDPFGLNC